MSRVWGCLRFKVSDKRKGCLLQRELSYIELLRAKSCLRPGRKIKTGMRGTTDWQSSTQNSRNSHPKSSLHTQTHMQFIHLPKCTEPPCMECWGNDGEKDIQALPWSSFQPGRREGPLPRGYNGDWWMRGWRSSTRWKAHSRCIRSCYRSGVVLWSEECLSWPVWGKAKIRAAQT